MRNLQSLRNFLQENHSIKAVLDESLEQLQNFDQQQPLASSPHPPQPMTLTDNEILATALRARNWLLGVLDCQNRVLGRDGEMRMFRCAIEKEINGQRTEWSEAERLYITLTDNELSSPEARLKAGFALVLQLNLAERLKDVSERACLKTDQIQRAAAMNIEVSRVRQTICEKAETVMVDHFACAIPLAYIESTATSVMGDYTGSCAICHNSYTAFSTFSIQELISDFPVRIKYCGHVIGKACLEQWMITPKIEEAKYPYRTCPLCRTKIEGLQAPMVPDQLIRHLETNRRAMETVRELVLDCDLELPECLEVVQSAMSEEIAAEQLLVEIARKRAEGEESGLFEKEEAFLTGTLQELKKERWAWGFRGNGTWRNLRDEWMNSGVVRK